MSMRQRIAAVVMLFAVLAIFCCASEAAGTLKMPNNLQVIGEQAFYGDRSLDKVVLPSGVREIRAKAFANSSLKEIFLPNSLTWIADDAFDKPEKVTIRANAGTYAYLWAAAHGYLSATPTEGLVFESYGNKYYVTGYEGQDANVIIPAQKDGYPVTGIADCAFMWNYRISNVVVPNGVTYIGYEAFSNCTGLTGIFLPDSLTTINANAFKACSRLRSVTIPSGVETISSETFYSCISLRGVTIPDTVTTIGSKAFYNCPNLIIKTTAGSATEAYAQKYKLNYEIIPAESK